VIVFGGDIDILGLEEDFIWSPKLLLGHQPEVARAGPGLSGNGSGINIFGVKLVAWVRKIGLG
jgi:hypothetical protein